MAPKAASPATLAPVRLDAEAMPFVFVERPNEDKQGSEGQDTGGLSKRRGGRSVFDPPRGQGQKPRVSTLSESVHNAAAAVFGSSTGSSRPSASPETPTVRLSSRGSAGKHVQISMTPEIGHDPKASVHKPFRGKSTPKNSAKVEELHSVTPAIRGSSTKSDKRKSAPGLARMPSDLPAGGGIKKGGGTRVIKTLVALKNTNAPRHAAQCCTRKGFVDNLVFLAAKLSDSTQFAVMTTSLTFYALFGDDFRLATMQKKTDYAFDVITCFCIAVFTVEVLATCLSKVDYIGSFFFWLDVLPTGTLILDLTFVADALFCSNVDGGSALKTGRAGRAGARAGRTVRIIRLVRLVKVYKIYVAAKEKEEKKKHKTEEEAKRLSQQIEISQFQQQKEWQHDGTGSTSRGPGESSAELSVDVDSYMQQQGLAKEEKKETETRVGKKLSEMTTRRVICLVLIMLFGLPQFLPGSHGYDELKSSPSLGIELVFEKWQKWCPFNETHPSELPACLQSTFFNTTLFANRSADDLSDGQKKQAEARFWYERYLLSFLYLHHDGDFSWKQYWIGLNSKNLAGSLGSAEAGERLARLGQLSQTTLLGNHSLPTSSWDDTFGGVDWVTDVVKLTPEVKARLTSPWQEQCMTFHGVAVRPGEVVGGASCTLNEDLRCMEMAYFTPLTRSDGEADDIQLLFVFNKSETMKSEASLSILQTIFICLAVGIGAIVFNNDANQLLLKPIERMMTKLDTIKDNPMAAMRLGDIEFKRQQNDKTERKDRIANAGFVKKCWYHFKAKQKIQEPMETMILEKTIIKLGGLLALCFGEEGGEIIGKYIGDSSGASVDSASVDIMVAGRRVDAIVAFCHIRDCDYVTKTLEEKALLFVNLVSEIVHLITDDCSGAPNKNIGDSFLLAWNYDEMDDKDDRMKLNDMAILACCKICTEVRKSKDLKLYCIEHDLTIEGTQFAVGLGLGLHVGWAIEGAIGSPFKIDASYVSPNVKIADHLQQATNHYGTSILLSDVVIASCSPEMAAMCRVIDQVTVQSLRRPMRIHTIDLDTAPLCGKSAGPDHLAMKNKFKNRYKWRQWQDRQKAMKWEPEYKVCDQFVNDPDLVKVRAPYTSEFYRRFFTAYRNYEAGEWMVARDLFYTCHYEPKFYTPPVDLSEKDWPKDGPTRALLHFMQDQHFESPPDWAGTRYLPR